MRKQVKEFIEKYQMLSQGDGVIIGISGGADSVCLFSLLCKLKEEYALRLSAVHVNHGIRGEEADKDEAYVRALCRKYDVPCTVYRENIPALAETWGMTEEEAGRTYRYQCFEQERKKLGFTKIAVAHNKEDLVETVIFHLIRGSSLRGMTGILPVRGNIIRPLLNTMRGEIEEYLKTEELSFQNDATNSSPAYDRNRIRSRILPEMTAINKKAVEHICDAAYDAEAAYMIIQRMAEEFPVVTEEGKAILDKSRLLSMDSLVQGEIIRQTISGLAGSEKDITRQHISSIQKLAEGENGKLVMLPYGLCVRNSYEKLIFEKRKELKDFCIEFEKDGNYQIEQGTLSVEFLPRSAISEVSKNIYTKMADCDNIKETLTFRTPREGDYIVINASGGRKKLARLFTDEKIDRKDRECWPLVACGSEIIWAVGLRFSEAYKITEQTKNVMILSFNGKETTNEG